MKLKFVFLGLVTILCVTGVSAQENSVNPEIGKPVPAFELTNLGNYPKKKMASADFKGKFVIIDFWNKNCVSCVQSFPKLSKLHSLYKDKNLDLILVGTEEEGIQKMFENFKAKQDLKFAYAFNFPLYKAFVLNGAPHLVWIDDQGVVKAVSYGNDLTTQNIDAFLEHKPFEFNDKSHLAYAKQELNTFDGTVPFLFDGNGGGVEYQSQLRYRSLITEYIPGMPKKDWDDVYFFRRSGPPVTIVKDHQLLQVTTTLKELYQVAYTGYMQWFYGEPVYNEIHGKVILELSDSSAFNGDREKDFGMYWYSLMLPNPKTGKKVSAAYLMECMQVDLKRYFGYEARLEVRKFPVLKLVATDKANKLTSKTTEMKITKIDHATFNATGVMLNDFISSMMGYHNYWESGGKVPVVLNETGITQRVDINVKGAFSDWKDVQRIFKDLGFELVPGEKEFRVLVVSDQKNP